MGLQNQLKVDDNLAEDGVWVELGIDEHNGKPIEIQIVYMNENKEYNRELARIGKEHRNLKALRQADEEFEIRERMAREAFCNVIVKGWRNVEEYRASKLEAAGHLIDEAGEYVLAEDQERPWVEMAFNAANVYFFLTDIPVAYRALAQLASNFETFRKVKGDRTDDTVKN